MNNISFPILLLTLFCLHQIVQSSNSSYSPEDSRYYLQYCKVSYCSSSSINSWSCIPCKNLTHLTDVKVVDKPMVEGQAMTSYDTIHQIIVVAFRGSEGILNWIYNLDFFEEAYPYCENCQVHTGFYKTMKKLQPDVHANLQYLIAKYPKAEIAVTGHSLGAALAILFAANVVELGGHVNYVYSYGQPRFGNNYTAMYIHSLLPYYQRVTHFKDPVPHVPMRKLFGYEFMHPPNENYYQTKHSDLFNYQTCNNISYIQENPTCADRWKLYQAISVYCHEHYLGVYTGCGGDAFEESPEYMERMQHDMEEFMRKMERQGEESEVTEFIKKNLYFQRGIQQDHNIDNIE